jgi:hypothetical protein
MQITPHEQKFQAFANIERRFDMSRFIGIASSMVLALVLMTPHDQTMAEPAQVLQYTNENLKGGTAFSTPDKVYTREEILKAKPLPWAAAAPAGQEHLRGDGFKDEPPSTDEPPEKGKSQAPDPDANRNAQREFADQWQLIEELDRLAVQGLLPKEFTNPTDKEEGEIDFDTDINFGTEDIYTGYSANRWSQMWQYFPWNSMGKLLIDGGGYCTAQVISPKNLIVTAAHCVYNNGWYRGWTFVPAERYGATPYGQFRWMSAVVLPEWATTGGRRYDVALIQLANNSSGQSVTSYVGYLGWRQNYPYIRNLTSFGYASNISQLYTSACAAESYSANCEGTDVLVKGCNMTYGSSGGGWIDMYKPYEGGASNYVEAVVSGPSCTGTFGNTFVGPRFSTANFGQLCAAYGGC